ncbi:c-type cytochrome [Sessilibacter sp. MAH2]
MKKISAAIIATFVSFGAMAAGDPAAGQAKSAFCASCHGPDGKTTVAPNYPKIGGQNADYLVNALKAYRAGERKGGLSDFMTPMAAGLSDQDIEDLAAYFASL